MVVYVGCSPCLSITRSLSIPAALSGGASTHCIPSPLKESHTKWLTTLLSRVEGGEPASQACYRHPDVAAYLVDYGE